MSAMGLNYVLQVLVLVLAICILARREVPISRTQVVLGEPAKGVGGLLLLSGLLPFAGNGGAVVALITLLASIILAIVAREDKGPQ